MLYYQNFDFFPRSFFPFASGKPWLLRFWIRLTQLSHKVWVFVVVVPPEPFHEEGRVCKVILFPGSFQRPSSSGTRWHHIREARFRGRPLVVGSRRNGCSRRGQERVLWAHSAEKGWRGRTGGKNASSSDGTQMRTGSQPLVAAMAQMSGTPERKHLRDRDVMLLLLLLLHLHLLLLLLQQFYAVHCILVELCQRRGAKLEWSPEVLRGGRRLKGKGTKGLAGWRWSIYNIYCTLNIVLSFLVHVYCTHVSSWTFTNFISLLPGFLLPVPVVFVVHLCTFLTTPSPSSGNLSTTWNGSKTKNPERREKERNVGKGKEKNLSWVFYPILLLHPLLFFVDCFCLGMLLMLLLFPSSVVVPSLIGVVPVPLLSLSLLFPISSLFPICSCVCSHLICSISVHRSNGTGILSSLSLSLEFVILFVLFSNLLLLFGPFWRCSLLSLCSAVSLSSSLSPLSLSLFGPIWPNKTLLGWAKKGGQRVKKREKIRNGVREK